MAPSVPALGAGFDEFLAEEALQVLENTADADCLALRYGGEVSLRGSRGLCLSVAPVKAGEAVAFAASVAGLGLGRREERFVVVNALLRDDRGRVKYGDLVAFRSRLAREKCLGARDDADRDVGFARNLVGAGERWEVAPALPPVDDGDGTARRRGATAPAARRGDPVRSGDAVALRSPRGGDAYLRRAARDGEPDEARLGRRDGLPGPDETWQVRAAGAPHWSRWHDDRPYLSGTFLAWEDRGDDVGEEPPRDADAFERALVEDCISALGGREGGRVRVVAGGAAPTFAVDDAGAPPFAAPLLDVARRVVPLGEKFLRARAFARSRSRYEYGRVAHALAARLRGMLRDYLLFLAMLETKARSAKGLGLQHLWYLVRDAEGKVHALAAACDACEDRKGGGIVDALRDRCLRCPDDAGRSCLDELTRAAAVPYLASLRKWLTRGVLDDPYLELPVSEDRDASKDDVATDFNAMYWDTRFAPAPERAAGVVLRRQLNKTVVAGKYLHVLRDVDAKALETLFDDWGGRDPFLDVEPMDLVDDKRADFARAIEVCYEAASVKLKALLFERGDGVHHLNVLKKFFLASQGDFLVNFMDLADDELDRPSDKVSVPRLQHLLGLALSLHGARDERAGLHGLELSATLAPRGLQDHLDAIHTHAADDDGDARLAAPLLGADAFVLEVAAAWPASIVLSRRAVVKYQLVFRHLFRAKRLERRLLGVWTGHMATKDLYRSRDGRARRDLGRAFHLNARMLHFAQNLMHYTMFEVVEARHADLLADVDKARTVDDALKCHDVFLDFVLKECLLANHKLLGLLADLDRAARAFANAADRFRDAALFPAATAPPRGVRAGHLHKLASAPAYVDAVAAMDADWTKLMADFLFALRNECHIQRNSHLADLYNRLYSQERQGGDNGGARD